MEGQDIRGLMEAYSQVHETPEVLNEEVVELSDEDLNGVELIEMTFEELEMLVERGQPGAAGAMAARNQRIQAQGQVKSALGQGKGIGLQSASGLGQGTKPGQKAFGTQLGGRQGVVVKGGASGPNYGPRGGSSFTRAADTVNVGGQTLYKAKKGNDIVYLQGKNKPQLFKPGQSSPAKPAAPAAPAKPAAPAAPAKPGAPTATSKPTTPAAPAKPAKPAGSAMDQWRAANPKLAAAADEKARIRGTSQTDNPLMKDMRSKMSMTPSVQSPTLAKDLGKGGGNQSLLNNPNASKAATPKPAPTAAAKPTGFDLAKKGVNLAADVDIFDLVKGHLLDEGYAETEQNAFVMMANMSEEWRQSILEAHGVQLDEAEIMKHQKERDRIEADKAHEADRVKKARSAYGKLSRYSPPTKGKHGEIERRQAQRPPSKLRSGSLPEEYIDEEETLTEKLAKGTKGVSFSTGRHQGGFEQAMTEKNPRTGRQRKTSPEMKAIGAHSKAKSAQWKAEHEGDHEAAAKHKKRRDKIAHIVYNKTRRIIDRADND